MKQLLKIVPICLSLIYVVCLALITIMPCLILLKHMDVIDDHNVLFACGIIGVIIISMFYNEIYDKIISYTQNHHLGLGRMNAKGFLISLGWILTCCILSCLFSAISYGRPIANIIVPPNDVQLKAYKEYYMATEELLDSIGVDVDDPILESDVGANYLDKKCVVDQWPHEP